MANLIVRHGAMRLLGEFEPNGALAYPRGARVVVQTERGQEAGDVLCPASSRALELLAEPTHGKIVRMLTDADRAQLERCKASESSAFDECVKGPPPLLVDHTGREARCLLAKLP